MSYGTIQRGECPSCSTPVSIVDYHADPPPIPMHVTCDVYRYDDFEPGSRLLECEGCGLPFDKYDYNPETGKLEEIVGDCNGRRETT